MTLIKDDQQPPYLAMATVLRREIQAGDFKPGQKLPSVRDLGKRFGLVSDTASKALSVLRDEGLITTVPGRGSWVRTEADTQTDVPDAEGPSVKAQLAHLSSQVQQLNDRVAELEKQLPDAVRSGSKVRSNA